MSSTFPELPDPALVVLVGAAGSGKSTWAEQRYRAEEIVSSDRLRAVVGTGPADLDASDDAFALLDQIVAARARRGLATVIDTLGLDPVRRRGYRDLAAASGLPAVLVLLDTPAALCRKRNSQRDRPVPAAALTAQLRRVRETSRQVAGEAWDLVVTATTESEVPLPVLPVASAPAPVAGLEFVLQVSRFPWGAEPLTWLRSVVGAAEEAGFAGIALMDHLIQIPQVGRAWDPIPEPWVTLGAIAAMSDRLKVGTLVSPVTFRAPGVLAKTVATLDALTGGRTFCGIGAGWWEREHQAFGLDFPSAAQRFALLEQNLRTLRALWSPGTKAYDDGVVQLPETTCYPRPAAAVPIIVGGGGERRTLRIAAELGDACNLPSDLETLDHKLSVLRAHCQGADRPADEVAVTVLDIPVIGGDRAAVQDAVERLRGRTPANTFAKRHHAGTVADHVDRYRMLACRGVSTVFLSLPDLTGPDEIARCAPILAAFSQ